MKRNMPPYLLKPRAGFFALFLVLSSGMSRFTSLFLRDRHLNDSQVGIALGVSSLSFLAVPFFTAFADKTGDRTAALLGMTLIGTLLVFLQGFVDLQVVSSSAAPIYLTVLRFLIASSLAPQSPVLDALAVDGHLEIANYGHERLWGAVSWGLMHLLIGGLIDLSGTYVLFYMMIVSSLCYLSLLYIWRKWRDSDQLYNQDTNNENENETHLANNQEMLVVNAREHEHKDEHEHNHEREHEHKHEHERDPTTLQLSHESATGNMCDLLRAQAAFACSSFRVTMFLFDIFLLSAGTSVVEGLLFLFFKTTMNASNFLLGWTVVMTVIFEIPLFAMSDKIMSRFSTRQLMAVAHVAYVVRVFGYTFIPPDMSGLILLFEPLHGVTYALKQMCAVTVLAKIAPKGFKNSAQGVVSTVGRLGSLTGSIGGGFVLQYLGPNVLYRGAGILVALAGVLYLVSDTWCGSETDRMDGGSVRSSSRGGSHGGRGSVSGNNSSAVSGVETYQELEDDPVVNAVNDVAVEVKVEVDIDR